MHAIAMVSVIISQSRMRLESHGSAMRMRNVASAKLPRMNPMVEAERPMDVP
jgi:hypothetical protein